MDIYFELVKYSSVLFTVSIALFMSVGWLLGRYRSKRSGDAEVTVRDALVAAIFGLSALVLGFTFSSSSRHYEARVENMQAQASAIKEVYIATKYLQPSDQTAIKNSLNDLLLFRLSAYKNIASMKEIDATVDRLATMVRQINEDIAKAVIRAPQDNQPIMATVVLPQMRNLVTSFNLDEIKTKSHPAELLTRFFYMLLCIGSMLIGYTMAVKNENDWFLAAIYIFLMGFGLYVILSLEYPNLLMPYDEYNRDLLLLKDFLKAF